jgi:hypothetical protein
MLHSARWNTDKPRAKPTRPNDRVIVHRAMWADPLWQPDMYAPDVRAGGQGDIRHNGASERRAPLAVLELPNGKTHEVYAPERGRLGFRVL